MEAENRITRLTEREKEALRRWLGHKTAKEIALDLGISHHAVEKRLKMARVKLGVGSSLEAARALAAAERYQQAVTGSAGLQSASQARTGWRHQTITLGGIAMLLTTIFALALVSAGQPAIDARTPADTDAIELDANMAPIFDKLDQNGSGYLEQPESPFVTMALIGPANPTGAKPAALLGDSTDPDQVAEFYKLADTDADGRISFREFHVWNSAQLAELGITGVLKLRPLPES